MLVLNSYSSLQFLSKAKENVNTSNKYIEIGHFNAGRSGSVKNETTGQAGSFCCSSRRLLSCREQRSGYELGGFWMFTRITF